MLFTRVFFFFLLAGVVLALPALGEVRLPVSDHRQEHSLSCEVAALKIALSAHGISVSESELISKLPFDPAPKIPGSWGDPNRGFVGKINGKMLVDGYGVYWDPIAQLGENYAPTQVIRNGSAADIARQISGGNPVIIWGYFGRRAAYHWRSSAGQPIQAINGEHTRVVYGYDGTVENPTRFYLLDPLYGRMNWSTEQLMHNWSALGHMAVVVLPPREWVRIPGDPKVWEIDLRANTRRWVTTWETFIRRGGSPAAVTNISSEKLLYYQPGPDII